MSTIDLTKTTDKIHTPAELCEDDGVQWFRDDFPLWGALSSRIAQRHLTLLQDMYARRAIATNGLTYYMYSETTASWSQLYSEISGSELLEMTGINAPVNFARPLKKIYALLKKIAFPLGRIVPSLCIGTYRLVFMCEYQKTGITVYYRPHTPLLPRGTMDEMYDRILTFVVCPIILPSPSHCPFKVNIVESDDIIGRILLPLRPDQKIDFLWRLGRAVTDPIKGPSVIVMFGRSGHEGKTKLCETITKLLADAVEWVNEDLFGAASKWPDVDTVMELCEKRILVCDECKIKDGFNYDNVKKWTSESPVSMKGRSGFLAQTAIVTSNQLPFFEKAAINNSIGRRMVIYHMKKRMSNYKPVESSDITNMVALRFISLALSVSSAFERPPTSLAIALYTLFRKNINKITAGLVHDVAATRYECLPATCAMAMRCGVPPQQLCQAFTACSPSLVDSDGVGLPYIRSIRYLKKKLTEHGQMVVDKRAEVTKQYINLDALLERGVEFSY